jgi:antitoxin YefM
MPTHSIEEAQNNLQRLINEVADSHKPIMIMGEKSNAVLIDAEDWSSIQETLYLLSMPGMGESIKEGMATPLEECESVGIFNS